ncbi:MAG: dienelactone hydrolase family protein [Caulobacteraceae bacterium]|nr:MAG: dienelactone hydrolase family protein [Caulobacteraceae bacterium]
MDGTPLPYSADGAAMIGRLFEPAGIGAAPLVLVAHESPGITEHTLQAARRMADKGFLALAVDYQGGGQVVTDRDEVMRRYARFMSDPAFIRARMGAALAALKAHPRADASRVAAIGFCYGGTAALELARSGEDLKCVVGFHSGLGTARPEDAAAIKGKVMVCIGADDPVIPAEQRTAFEAEMRAGGVDWRLNLYGGTGHSFTNPEADGWRMPGFAFHRQNNDRALQALDELFDEVFGRVRMIPAGYMFRRLGPPPPPFLSGLLIRRVCSATCVGGEDLVDLYASWSHNSFCLANSPEQLMALAGQQGRDPADGTILYFEAYEQEVITGGQIEAPLEWGPITSSTGNAAEVSLPARAVFLGFDVVVYGDTLEHSPLSCQEVAREVAVNEHCLIDRFEAAKAAIDAGAFFNCKEGAYRIYAVYELTT